MCSSSNKFKIKIGQKIIDYSNHVEFKGGAWTYKDGSRPAMVKKHFPDLFGQFNTQCSQLDQKFECEKKLLEQQNKTKRK